MAPSITVCAMTVVILMTTASVVESIKCYKCQPTDASCNTVSSSTATCNGNYCYNSTYTSSSGVIVWASRWCLTDGTVGCLRGTDGGGYIFNTCICPGDLCNGVKSSTSSRKPPSGIALVAVAGLVVALFIVNRQ